MPPQRVQKSISAKIFRVSDVWDMLILVMFGALRAWTVRFDPCVTDIWLCVVAAMLSCIYLYRFAFKYSSSLVVCYHMRPTAKVMNDFQSKHLKEEWENRQRAILASRNERIAEDERRRVGLEQELNVFRARNAETQAKLDAKVDSANARFADLQVELQYEVDRVEKKVGQGGPKGADGAAAPCVTLRADLAACFREADDVRKCDGYIEALERCVKVEVVKQ